MSVSTVHRRGTEATSSTTPAGPGADGSPRALPARLLADAGRGALLLPRAVATVGSAATRRRPNRLRVAGYGLCLLPLGLLALLPVGTEVLFVLRGVFYGLVDHGPYNHSWGGPTRAGAWTAHFLIGLPFAAAGLLVLAGLQRLAQRMRRLTRREPVGAWPWAVVLVASIAGALLFNAWLHQI